MFNRKPKSLLRSTWLDIFKKIENNKILCAASYDCLGITLDQDGLLTVSHPERVTEAISRILEDIKVCCKDLQAKSFPIKLSLIGPNCAKHINVKSFWLISDPDKSKLIHNFYNRVENVKVIQPELLSKPDINSLCMYIKDELRIAGTSNFKEKIETWLKNRIEKDEIFSKNDKEVFLDIVAGSISPQKKSIHDRGDFRNDMQRRRHISRLSNNLKLHMDRLFEPVHTGIKKFFMHHATSTTPKHIYDAYSEISARKARTRHLLNRAHNVDTKDTALVMKHYEIPEGSKNAINTLLVGILFIFKEPGFKVELLPLLDLWDRLEAIIIKDI